MTTFKRTTAGMERDGDRARARYDSVEFDIPSEVLSQGLGAIINWVNKSPKYIAGATIAAAVGTAIASSLSLNDSDTGLREWCDIELRRGFLDFSRNIYIARVLDDILLFRPHGKQAALQIPTAAIGSLSSLKDGSFILQYLDDTVVQGVPESSEILIEPRGGLLNLGRGVPEKIQVQRIKFIRSVIPPGLRNRIAASGRQLPHP